MHTMTERFTDALHRIDSDRDVQPMVDLTGDDAERLAGGRTYYDSAAVSQERGGTAGERTPCPPPPASSRRGPAGGHRERRPLARAGPHSRVPVTRTGEARSTTARDGPTGPA